MTLPRGAAAPLASLAALALLVACSPAGLTSAASDPATQTITATTTASAPTTASSARPVASSVDDERIAFPGGREPRNMWSVAVNGKKVAYADKPVKGTATLTLLDTRASGPALTASVALGKGTGVRMTVDALMTDPASGHDLVVWHEAWATEGGTPLRSPDGRPQLWRINVTDMQTGATRVIDEAQEPEAHYWAAISVSAADDTIVWTRRNTPDAVTSDGDSPHSAWTWSAGAAAPTRFAEFVVYGDYLPQHMTNGTVAYVTWQTSVNTWTTGGFPLSGGAPIPYSSTGDLLAIDDTHLYFSRPADGSTGPVIVRQAIGSTAPGTPVGDPTNGRISSIVVVGDGILIAVGDDDRFFLDTATGVRTDFSERPSGGLVLGNADGVAWEVKEWWSGKTRHFHLAKVTLTR